MGQEDMQAKARNPVWGHYYTAVPLDLRSGTQVQDIGGHLLVYGDGHKHYSGRILRFIRNKPPCTDVYILTGTSPIDQSVWHESWLRNIRKEGEDEDPQELIDSED